MGLTFKENCADIRNSGVRNVIEELKKYNCSLDLFDPWASNVEIKKNYGIAPCTNLNYRTYDAVLIAVAHKKFKQIGETEILNLCKQNHVIYDLKHLFSNDKFSLRL